jgi:hypothetical protein
MSALDQVPFQRRPNARPVRRQDESARREAPRLMRVPVGVFCLSEVALVMNDRTILHSVQTLDGHRVTKYRQIRKCHLANRLKISGLQMFVLKP